MQLNSDEDEKFFFKLEFDKNLNITVNDYIYLKGLKYITVDEQKKIDYFENSLSRYFVKLPDKIITQYYDNDL